MSITINNYEAYLLDYFEGSLSTNEKADLIAFVFAHPELEIELDDNLHYLEKEENTSQIDKTKLKSLAVPSDNEYISFIENQLTGAEKKDFKRLIETNKTYKDNLSIWEKTILDKPEITFPKKRSLKHYSITPVVYSIMSAAAIFILFFTVFNNSGNRQYFSNKSIPVNTQIAKETEEDIFNFNNTHYSEDSFSRAEVHVIKPNNFVAKNISGDTNLTKQYSNESTEIQNNPDSEIAQENKIINHSDETEKKVSVDSTILPSPNLNPKTESEQTFAQEKNSDDYRVNKKDTYSVKEWVVNKLQEKDILDSTENNPTVLEIAANTIGEFDSKEDENEKVTVFKIGKFEYYRKKSKHL